MARGAALLSFACLGGCNREGTPSELPRPGDVVRIRLEQSDPANWQAPPKVAVLTERRDVEELLSLASFARKPPCGCAHFEEVAFETATGSVRASICDHCFDVRADGKVGNYAMSAKFYSAFQDLLARRGVPVPK